MVDRDFMPLGFCLAYLRPPERQTAQCIRYFGRRRRAKRIVRVQSTVTIHAYFGDWLKVYPKDILKGMKPVIDRIRDAGITEVYAIAEESVPGADVLLKWFKGEATGQFVPGQGQYYRVDLRRTPI